MKALSENAARFIREHYDEYVDLTLTLAQIPAPSNHEEKRAEFVKKTLESYGCKGVVADEALNVYYPYRCEGKKKIHIISGHSDVVFEDTEPLPLKREGSVVYCPGIGDDTANATLVMMLAKYIAETRPETEDGILLSVVSGEEGLGNLKGVRKIMETYGDRTESFVTFDAAFGSLASDCVGSTRYEVTVREDGGHSYGKFGNPNAIIELAELITKLDQVKVPKKEGTKTTYNVGMISGGISVNTIPPEAKMLYEYRSDDLDSLQVMKAYFDRCIAEAKEKYKEVEVKVVGERPCSAVDPEKQKKLIDDLHAIHLLYDNNRAVERHSSMDFNIPMSMGIPSGCVGTHICAGAHTRGEWLDLAGAERALKVAFSVLELYL